MQRMSMEEREKLTGKPREWLEGWEAFMKGKEMKDCPYEFESEFRKRGRWIRGWEAAQEKNSH